MHPVDNMVATVNFPFKKIIIITNHLSGTRSAGESTCSDFMATTASATTFAKKAPGSTSRACMTSRRRPKPSWLTAWL